MRSLSLIALSLSLSRFCVSSSRSRDLVALSRFHVALSFSFIALLSLVATCSFHCLTSTNPYSSPLLVIIPSPFIDTIVPSDELGADSQSHLPSGDFPSLHRATSSKCSNLRCSHAIFLPSTHHHRDHRRRSTPTGPFGVTRPITSERRPRGTIGLQLGCRCDEKRVWRSHAGCLVTGWRCRVELVHLRELPFNAHDLFVRHHPSQPNGSVLLEGTHHTSHIWSTATYGNPPILAYAQPASHAAAVIADHVNEPGEPVRTCEVITSTSAVALVLLVWPIHVQFPTHTVNTTIAPPA
ncbi:hypothetical protein BD410DRAFT_844284 [Rickenella mellea]|uniref:C2H2-type domain-containing protein n=1 Tax=Rickenella mellea TaxID=50990 RepID=A0A4Y7PNW8_9AGAM|nr:hypothetical protein BD410DRAFT_844284 [Rickenella mellea]